jgi:hypothetical protein
MVLEALGKILNMPLGSAASQAVRSDTTALKKRMEKDKKEIKVHNKMMESAGPQETKYRKEAKAKANDRLDARNDTLQAARRKKP